MKLKGVIFDLDGTLVDSLEDIADSMNMVLTNHNFPVHDLQAYKYFIGNGIKNLVRKALPESERTEELIEECYKSMTEIYSKNYLNKTKPYNGVEELLEKISEKELKLAVLSNKDDNLTKEIIKALFPEINFIAVQGLTDQASKKPNPVNALKIKDMFGIASEEVLYVGDTSVDMQTANNAKMYPAGVLWGFREREELLANGAKIIAEKPEDLLSVLLD